MKLHDFKSVLGGDGRLVVRGWYQDQPLPKGLTEHITDEAAIELKCEIGNASMQVDMSMIEAEHLIDSLRQAVNHVRHGEPEAPAPEAAAQAAAIFGNIDGNDHHFVPYTTSATSEPPNAPGVCSIDGCDRTDAH